MNLEYLARHQKPRPPERDIRGQRVVDSQDNEIGNVAGLYVDRAERKLRFVHVVTQGFLGRGNPHRHGATAQRPRNHTESPRV